MREDCKTYLALILCCVLSTNSLEVSAIASQPSPSRTPGWSVKLARLGDNASGYPRNLDLTTKSLQAGQEGIVRSASLHRPPQPQTVEEPSQEVAHSLPGQTGTLLPDGSLLLLGGRGSHGALALALIKDPKSNALLQLPRGLNHARYGHTATVLPDGTVLILGGLGIASKTEGVVELFDPASLTFTDIPTSGLPLRSAHTATLLTDDSLLIAGGRSLEGATLSKVELWSPAKPASIVSVASLITARKGHTATLQPDGTVLFWGGKGSNGTTLDYGEIYDPVTQSVRMQATPLGWDNSGPPLVEFSSPQDGEENVPLDTLIAVRFSRPQRVQTVAENTVTLSSSDAEVKAKVVAAESGMLAFVKPLAALTPATTYTLSLSGATDWEGVVLADKTITFTTAGDSTAGQPGSVGSESSSGSPFDSPWRKLPPLQARPGVTALAGQALQLNGEPLKSVTLQIGKLSTLTDATGRFLLQNISSGHQVMWIDGGSATRAKATYGVFEVGVDITAKQTNVLNYTIWMTPLDTAHQVTIPSPTVMETVVSNPLLPGLELHLPAGTIIHDWYGKLVTKVSITPIPVAQPPFPLPAGVQVPIYFTIQPGGAYLQGYGQSGFAGARLFYPNPQHYQPGTIFNFWNYDADNKGWYVYGQGMVAADARQVIPNPGVVIYEFTGAMVGNPPAPPTGPPAGGGGGGGGGGDGDPVDLQTGLFVYTKTDLSLPDVIPLHLTRTYRPMDPTSRGFGIGTTLNYDLFLTGDTWPYTYIDLILEDGGRIHFDRVSSGTGYTDAVYEHTTSPTGFYGAQIIYSNGWLITLKDGTQYQFPDCFLVNTPQACAPLQVTDRNGNTVTYARDPNSHNLTQVTSPNGRWIQLTYDSSNRVTQATDNMGRSVYYTYDTSGRLWTVKDVNGGTTTFAYDISNNMTSIVDPRQLTYVTNYYDANNRVYKQVLADGSMYQFSYVNAGGNPTCVGVCPISGSNIIETDVTNPRQYVRKATFNSDGYTSADTSAVGRPEQQTLTFNREPGSGLLLSVTDMLNRQTTEAYDAKGNVSGTTALAGDPSAFTVISSYDPKFSNVTSVADPLGHTVLLSYDIQGDVTSVTDALGNSSTFKYDSAGRLSGITDPNGSTAQFSYSGTDQVSITDSLGRSITQFFDGAGRRISVTNPLGQTTQYQYDPLNNVTKITDPLAGSTLVTYDANGNTLTVADPVNPSTPTTYTYDSMNRVATRRDPLGNTESFQYDANGNLSQFTDRRGKVATFSYDALDRLMFAGYGMQAGPTYESTVTYTYDAGNRLVQVADSASGTFTLGHDNLDRLTSETGPQGTISYTYDAAARRITSTVAGQATVNYTYDAANRLTQISQGTATVSFGYDAVGRRGSLTVPNGITVNYNYDAASELTGLTYSLGAMSLGSLSYAYDNNGLRTSTAGSYARTGLPNPLTTAAYNANNELTTWGGANLSYDANGNLTGDGTHTYAWDARNRLIAIDGGSTASFAYDPFGRRTGKTILGTTTSYLYDNNNLVQELSGASASANWLTGLLDDEYFTRTDSSGVRNFLADALGTTIALADSTGTIQTQYTVEPYGNTTTGGAATTNSVVYAAREMDLANLYFFRARYYNPQLGRFISEDPAGFEAGMNFYAYVHNSPIDFADPTGSFTVDRSGLKQQRTLFIDGPCGAGTGGACTRMDYVGVKADCAKGKCSDDWKATAVALVEQGTMYIYNGPWNTLRLPPKDKSVVDAKTAIAHEFNVHINPAEAAVAPLLNAFEAKTFKSKEDCIIEHGRLTPIVRSLFNQTLRETQQRENNQ